MTRPLNGLLRTALSIVQTAQLRPACMTKCVYNSQAYMPAKIRTAFSAMQDQSRPNTFGLTRLLDARRTVRPSAVCTSYSAPL